jgi:hypothetical protein
MFHSVSDKPPCIPPELIDEIINYSVSDKPMLATWAHVLHMCHKDMSLSLSQRDIAHLVAVAFKKIIPTITCHIYHLEIIVDGRAKLHVLHRVNRALDLLVDSGTDPRILHLMNMRFVKHGNIRICSWVPMAHFKHLEELVLKGCKFEIFREFDALLYLFPLLFHIALEDLNAHSHVSPLPLEFKRHHINLHHLSVKNITWFA